jgi:hypothetical protein
MEGVKHEFSAQIDEHGVLRMSMLEFKQAMKQYPNKKAVVTVEILDGGDVEIMKAWYRNYVLPKVVEAWRELGENYTTEQVDVGLRSDYTTSCHIPMNNTNAVHVDSVDDLDRERLKRYLDEVTIFAATNLNLAL